MANEIKLDTLLNVNTTKPARKEQAKPVQQTDADDATISKHLGALASSLNANSHTVDNSKRVQELKDQIANNLYRVDMDKLAAKLAHTLLNTK
jgi:anti-sigma28 factor (negative regulator of flagellin synthesis)